MGTSLVDKLKTLPTLVLRKRMLKTLIYFILRRTDPFVCVHSVFLKMILIFTTGSGPYHAYDYKSVNIKDILAIYSC